jgi:hypothetical protein
LAHCRWPHGRGFAGAPFAATTYYGLGILLNAAAQMRWAARLLAAVPADAAHAGAVWKPGGWSRDGLAFLLAILVADFVIYLCVGLTIPRTGSIAGTVDETAMFHGENGIDVRVSPADGAARFIRGWSTYCRRNRPGWRILLPPHSPIGRRS